MSGTLALLSVYALHVCTIDCECVGEQTGVILLSLPHSLPFLPSPRPPVQELGQLQEKHSTRPDVFDDVEEEQEIEILTQEITQVRIQVAFISTVALVPSSSPAYLASAPLG